MTTGSRPRGDERRLAPHHERSLRCPQCRGELSYEGSRYRCVLCNDTYGVEQHVTCLVSSQDRAASEKAFYNAADPQRYGRMEASASFIRQIQNFLVDCPDDGFALEIGSGGGAMANVHPAYVASDFSLFALLEYSGTPCVQADAQALPFADATIDAVFTWATLEHVPNPASVLEEIDRCLRPGGRAFIYPAWFVRPWASKALHVKRYQDLSWSDRLRKLTVPLRDSRGWWAAKMLPGRLAREIAIRIGRKPLRFSYRRLSPNLALFLASDSDAFSSMDPHAASTYFVSRDYADIARPNAMRRLLYGYEPVIVQKPRHR